MRDSKQWPSHLCTSVFVAIVLSEAFAVWQWGNFLRERVPPGKRAVHVNIDETAICMFQGECKGNILVSKRVRQPVCRQQRRTYLTHVACICDDPALQGRLPHYVIANERTATHACKPLAGSGAVAAIAVKCGHVFATALPL